MASGITLLMRATGRYRKTNLENFKPVERDRSLRGKDRVRARKAAQREQRGVL